MPSRSEFGAGWFREGITDGHRVTTIDARLFHRSLAEGIADAIGEGVPAQLIDGLITFDGAHGNIPVESTRLRHDQLREEIERAERRRSNAEATADDADDEDTRRRAVERADDLSRELRRLRAELESADSQPADETIPAVFHSDADYIAQALANLARAPLAAPGELDDALSRIITDLNVEPTPDSLSARWSCHVRLPVDGRVMSLGPIHGVVSTKGEPGLADPGEAQHALVKALVDEGVLPARLSGCTQLDARRALATHLTARGVPSEAVTTLTDCVTSAPFDALLSRTDGRATSLGAEYVARIWRVYGENDLRWRTGLWIGPSRNMQIALALLRRMGGEAGYLELQRRLSVMMSGTTVQYFAIGRDSQPPIMERYGPRGDYRVRLRSCPHCGTAVTHALRVPELPELLLCTSCQRPPSDGAPVFPDEYLALRWPEIDLLVADI